MKVLNSPFTAATLILYDSRKEWLAKRKSYIGGSDAGCILGVNKWKSNVELWEEKTGRRKPADISDNPLVAYGAEAEAPLRQLFGLDFPEMKVEYLPHNMWINPKHPWAHASLDGWLIDENKRVGVLEIKTTTISGQAQSAEWKDGIPQSYYAQILHYLMVTEFSFVIVKAQLKYEAHDDKELYIATKHYRIERADVEEEIEYLRQQEEQFAKNIEADQRPALLLPEI